MENSIKLIGELSQQVGSPVICLGGTWGRVCGPLDTEDAEVVCRQLGFSTESNIIDLYTPCMDLSMHDL